jgi:hypothetical protein
MDWQRGLGFLERGLIALLASFGAWAMGPELFRSLCLMRSTLMDQWISGALATAFIIAALRLRRRWQRWILIPVAPVVAFSATFVYWQWLHSELFPDFLIDADVREILAIWEMEANRLDPWLHESGPITATRIVQYEGSGTIEIQLEDDRDQHLTLYLDRQLRDPLSPASYALLPPEPVPS